MQNTTNIFALRFSLSNVLISDKASKSLLAPSWSFIKIWGKGNSSC